MNILKGPNAIAFGYEDPVHQLRLLSEFAKEHKNLEIKAGIVDGKSYDVEEIKELAKLPSKEVLIAQTTWRIQCSYYRICKCTSRNN